MTCSHMFRNSYQGGAVFEVFSGQGKDPAARWRLCGGPAAVHKEYNKEVKGFVYCLDGSSHTVKMQIPQDGKMSLGLFQRFLVLQVNVPIDRDFSIELVYVQQLIIHSIVFEFAHVYIHSLAFFPKVKAKLIQRKPS
uniref:CFA20 domain-containing protein n=1 Tax=Oryzias sinensis TaxID=183150 RepID=A0A8C7XIH8_9TELE